MKTIIEMAREAGAAVGSPAPNAPEIIFPQCLDVQRFAELVRADERAVLALEAKRNRNSTFALQLRARGNT